jgi:chorismate synthase
MAGNTFGTLLRLTTFGESHGTAIGGVLDGCPPNVKIDAEAIQKELDRRRPGQSSITSPRKESDKIEILSGVFEGVSTGAPVAFIIRNTNAQSADYDHLKNVYRPSHADYTYQQKYGVRDYRGGGRSSARETATRVAAGAIAKAVLPQIVSVKSFVSQVGDIKLAEDLEKLNLELIESNVVRCPDAATAERMQALIEQMRDAGDTLGGVITCVVRGVPAGWGEPVFDKLHADLGKAMLSINAVKGFEIGSGFAGVAMKGSEQNDTFSAGFGTTTNNSGGIQGGISNGQDIVFRVAFKPVATIKKEQLTVDASGTEITLAAKGRHDPCVLPRAVPIVDAMTNLVLADHYLRQNAISNLAQ